MARLQIDIDSETYQRLVVASLAERRPIPWQAEVILRRALGLSNDRDLAADEQSKSADPCADREAERVIA